jgi:hypothetical protein
MVKQDNSTNSSSEPVLSITFLSLDDEEKQLVKTLVHKNIDNKMSSYLNKIYTRMPDARVKIKATVSKNKREKGGFN